MVRVDRTVRFGMFDSIEAFIYHYPAIFIILGGVLIIGGDYLWNWLITGGNWLLALVKTGKSTISVSAKVTTFVTAETLAALQHLTTWAMTNGEPQLLAKITSLYSDLQVLQKAQPTAPVVTPVVTSPVPAPETQGA